MKFTIFMHWSNLKSMQRRNKSYPRIPSTSETTAASYAGFSGKVNGFSDELHTPAGIQTKVK